MTHRHGPVRMVADCSAESRCHVIVVFYTLVSIVKVIRFIRELRHREVFRALGFYIGVCWILIEAASIVLPAFEAPRWVLGGLFTVAIVGFPIAAVLAWIYDISAKGIVAIQQDVGLVLAGSIRSVNPGYSLNMLGRAQQGLDIQAAATTSFEAFLALRPEGGRFVDDARTRL